MENETSLTKIVVLGRDERQLALSNELRDRLRLITVSSLNCPEDLVVQSKRADCIVLPVSEMEGIDEVWVKALGSGTIILSGRVSKDVSQWCKKYGILLIGYLERADFQIANAVPTAEGSIKLYMDMTRQTVAEAKMLVLGFGHCGAALALRLKALGADVTVFARKNTDFVLGRSMGLTILKYESLSKCIGQGNCIFNTVPATRLDSSNLGLVRNDCIIIDLASAPGGTDFELCRQLGIEAVLAGGLPGRYFPKTAGKIVADTVIEILKENSLTVKSMIGGY